MLHYESVTIRKMDRKYNPSAYAKTGYQVLFREKEKGGK